MLCVTCIIKLVAGLLIDSIFAASDPTLRALRTKLCSTAVVHSSMGGFTKIEANTLIKTTLGGIKSARRFAFDVNDV